MAPPNMASNPGSALINSMPVPALISRLAPTLSSAPSSLSTITHLDANANANAPSATSVSSSLSASTTSRTAQAHHASSRRQRSDLHTAVSLPTAAHSVPARENISTSKTWSSGLARPHTTPNAATASGYGGESEGEFRVHPTFRSDAENRGDVLVRVDDVEFWVHKHVLLFSSPFFQSVLGGEWKESRLSKLRQDEAEDEAPTKEEEEEVDDATVPRQSQADPNSNTHDETTLRKNDATARDADANASSSSNIDRIEKLSKPAIVADHADDMAEELEADDMAASEVNSDYRLGIQTRRRSLLCASYHTALWSQDDESCASPTLLQCDAKFPSSTSSSNSEADEAEHHNVAEEGSSSEGDSKDDDDVEEMDTLPKELDNVEAQEKGHNGNGEVPEEDESPTKTSQQRPRRGGVGLNGVRSKSKHLAARLTLRKLESAQRHKTVPIRSTSKQCGLASAQTNTEPGLAISASSPSLGPQERFESLATPPSSRRASNEYPRWLNTKEENTQAAARAIQPSKFKEEKLLRRQNTSRKTIPSGYKNLIAMIDLVEESPSTFHDFLRHTYPHLDLSVTWYNCGPLLRFSDKFQVPFLRRSCLNFLRAALAGRPIEAMRLAELHGIDDLYKEASRHVLDNYTAWGAEELEVLSKETLLKLERKRTWFLERLLKLGLANPGRDYECTSNCPDPGHCAKVLHERWISAYSNAFRFSPPQPSVIFRCLRELDNASSSVGSSAGTGGCGEGATSSSATTRMLSSCQQAARVWVQGLFDRMFELGTLHTAGRLFLAIKLDAQVQRNASR
ncbi:uncharacterized protein MEPE_04858 [Melanopsichium pennsylvanicum]|uniref:BTB domain-containing protein n=2 Tax=Melanopsichium pennsylvanicum TaxID=63383 RepID=A0AAJ4XPJ4_9BASI|nr:conserved hypothetical protein [Melanopsichium pennsylvanicum 4]SNX86149.1 uncharacterized protein MEPE_04858 [Melanopsichium pennsylvanicum]